MLLSWSEAGHDKDGDKTISHDEFMAQWKR